jgi:N-acetylneuraminic acid mutarotase
MCRRILAIAAAVGLALNPATLTPVGAAVATTPETWTATGALQVARGYAPMVRLGDGSVITAGGQDQYTYFSTAERYDPSAGTWASAGSISQAATGQVAVALPDGKALFAGGTDGFAYYVGGDVFDPVAGTWTQTPAMVNAHAYGAAASLANGDVLVVGGYDGGATLTTAKVDIYDASEGTWSAGPPLPDGVGRFGLTATTLADGRVLVAGGDDGSLSSGSTLPSAAIYTSGEGWQAAESMPQSRFDHAAALLPDGRVLIAGGSTVGGTALYECEVYDPSTGHWTVTGRLLEARYGLTLSALADGRILAAGGYSSSSRPAVETAEIYDPTTGGWSPTGFMITGRRNSAAVALADGRVLVAGGNDEADTVFLSSAETYAPPTPSIVYPATTYHPLAPARILDTRIAKGLSGPFRHRSPRQFQVTGLGGVPAGAIAVTGILTVTVQSGGGYVMLGPNVTATPGSSTLNFPKGDNRANNVTVALSPIGQLSGVFVDGVGGSTHVIFDVTGYFTADDSGATYEPLEPARLLDTRDGTGLAGKFASKTSRTLQVSGRGGVPDGALAVTGNLTLVKPTGIGYAHISPDPINPSTLCCSTLNAPSGDIRANGVTVKLNAKGTVSLIWVGTAGSKTDLLFDVTGYYVLGLAGARFVPLEPARVVDTRYNVPLQGPLVSTVPATIPIIGRAHVPDSAVAITGNLTVTEQTYLGYATVAPTIVGTPKTSTLNFPRGDNRANGFTVRLSDTGSVDIGYFTSTTIPRSQLILDLTGYFVPAATP